MFFLLNIMTGLQKSTISQKSKKRIMIKKNTNEPHASVPFYTWIYWYTYYKTVLKELDNNSIFIALSSTIQYKYKNTHRMVRRQATVQIENKEEIQ